MPLHPPCRTGAAARRGSVSTWFALMLPVFLLAGLLAMNSGWMVDAKTAMQGSSDAAALAAGRTLVDDDFLRDDGDALRELISCARHEARHYARRNPVHACELELQRNGKNDPDGDIVFGTMEHPRATFVPADRDERRHENLKKINAVRIQARRTKERDNPIKLLGWLPSAICGLDAETRATAMLDGCVIGFHPVFQNPIPMAPVALYSCKDGKPEKCWEHQVRDRHGRDDWSFDCVDQTFQRRPDGLHEMCVELVRCGRDNEEGDRPGKNGDGKDGHTDGAKNDDGDDHGKEHKKRGNAFLLHLGADSADCFRRQIAEGLHCEHLHEFGGEFVLGLDNKLRVRGRCCAPDAGSELQEALLIGLQLLLRSGEPRVWPLYTKLEGKDAAVVTGFVAARVVRVDVTDEGRGVKFILQPTRMCTAAAVTTFDRHRPENCIDVNPYVFKVRLVD